MILPYLRAAVWQMALNCINFEKVSFSELRRLLNFLSPDVGASWNPSRMLSKTLLFQGYKLPIVVRYSRGPIDLDIGNSNLTDR